jgi:hypothetical protein
MSDDEDTFTPDQWERQISANDIAQRDADEKVWKSKKSMATFGGLIWGFFFGYIACYLLSKFG